jgi:SPP1 family predicted phage head-tail adaptor
MLFNKRIELQENEITVVEGMEVPGWTTIKNLWAALKTIQGREFFAADQNQNEYTARFVVRYAKSTWDFITEDKRISYKGRNYEIKYKINDDERNITITIIAKEVV